MNGNGAGLRRWKRNDMGMGVSAMFPKLPVLMPRPFGGGSRSWPKDLTGIRLTKCANQAGGGCRWQKKPQAEAALLTLIEHEVAGDPDSGEQWVCRSLRELQKALAQQGHALSHETIRTLLRQHKISAKSQVKRLVPDPHPERDRQFRYIQEQRQRFVQAGWPILSVDAKKKELIGLFQNRGQVWSRQATAVYMHDFPSDAVGRAVPYGLYDVQHNRGYVYVGQSADTPEFAVACISHWWQHWGAAAYPHAPALLILADGGGSNGYRPRCWKQQLQVHLADACRLAITVCHYPRGASKWNPVEHRLFSEISKTWAGIPLTSFEVMLACIRQTTTKTGLTIEAILIEQTYQKGLSVSDEEMASLALEKHVICPGWNYTIRPR